MWRVLLIVALVAAGCGGAEARAGDDLAPSATVVVPTTSPLPAEVPTTSIEQEVVVAEEAEAAPEVEFSAVAREVSAAELGVSWQEGCPVAVAALRWVDLAHYDDAGAVRTGSLVVHADHVAGVTSVFARLFDAAFPIHSMRPVTDFGADDTASMVANNTSAFNCREIAGRPGVWSQHAYGGAIDINPLVNPWVRGDRVSPTEGAPYVDRTVDVPGLIEAEDVVTQSFAEIGWGWGGDWTTTKDYQHFSHNGR